MKLETNKKAQVTPQSIVHTTQKTKIDTSMSNLIMDMLSKIYSNPLTAAIREYVSNGVDSHTAVNQTRPVEVTLPTKEYPQLIVRDYGQGMDMFDILTIFGNFGTSSKRESDDFIGGFGIGSKSGLAISDIIDVESIKDGVMNQFRIKRDGQEIITQFVQENVPVENKPSGTRVEITVSPNYVRDIDDQDYTRPINTYNMRNVIATDYMSVLAGWKKSQVIAKCAIESLANICNNYRIRDIYHELDHGFIANNTIIDKPYQLRGFLVGDVFYQPNADGKDILSSDEIKQITWSGFKQSVVIKLDISKTQVAYSREQIEFNGSTRTRAHVIDRITKVRDEIKAVVADLQSDPNITPDIYVNKLMAAGIDIERANHEYLIELSKTKNFDLMQKINVTIDEVQAMDINQNHNDSYTVGQVHMDNNEVAKTDLVAHKLILLVEPNEKMKAPATYRRYVKEAFEAYAADGNDVNGCMALAQKAMKNYPRYGWRSSDLVILIMKQETLNQYAFRHLATVIHAKDIIAVAQNARANNRKQHIANKNVRVYMFKTKAYMSQIKDLHDLPSTDDICVLPAKSKYSFNTKNCTNIHYIIRDLLNFNLVCVQNASDFDIVKNHFQQAWFPTDDKLENTLKEIVKKYAWSANDTFCRIWTKTMANPTIAYVDTNDQNCDALALPLIDGYLEVINKMHNNPYEINNILQYIESSLQGPTSTQLLTELHQTAKDADAAGPTHKVTYALRIGKSLVNAPNTMLTYQEAQQFMHDIARDYQDELNHLKSIY